MKPTIDLFIGSPIELESEKDFLGKLSAELLARGQPALIFANFFRDSSLNSTAGRIRPGCHAHVFVSMECPGLPESLGPAHEAVSMAPKSLAQHHLRFISWSRGGDRRGISFFPLRTPIKSTSSSSRRGVLVTSNSND